MPSAMQNDVHMEHAKQIVANGVKYYIEVANMPTTNVRWCPRTTSS